jgi:selenide,water dikinase
MVEQAIKKIVCVGGGHCNVQVLKLMKQKLPAWAKITVVTDNPIAYYSGMLPGSSSNLYHED